jgi:hypothetical protein
LVIGPARSAGIGAAVVKGCTCGATIHTNVIAQVGS